MGGLIMGGGKKNKNKNKNKNKKKNKKNKKKVSKSGDTYRGDPMSRYYGNDPMSR